MPMERLDARPDSAILTSRILPIKACLRFISICGTRHGSGSRGAAIENNWKSATWLTTMVGLPSSTA
jgi:hypothetical protein